MDSTIKNAINTTILLLQEKNVINPNNKETIVDALHSSFGHINTHDWSVDDVMCLAAQSGYVITEEDAENVLETVYDEWDAGYGINWDFIQHWLDDYVKSNKIPTTEPDDRSLTDILEDRLSFHENSDEVNESTLITMNGIEDVFYRDDDEHMQHFVIDP